jgi:hypothetical protein
MGQMGQNPFLRPIMIGGVRIIASLDMVAVVEDWSRGAIAERGEALHVTVLNMVAVVEDWSRVRSRSGGGLHVTVYREPRHGRSGRGLVAGAIAERGRRYT